MFAKRVTATGQAVARPVAAGDQVGRRLRRLVGRGRLQGELLPVGKPIVGAVGLVARRRRPRAPPHRADTPRAASTCPSRSCRMLRAGSAWTVPTIVSAARWKTVSTSWSSITRDTRPSSMSEPASSATASSIPRSARVEGRSLGVRRSSETTRTPLSSSALHNHAPTNPRPPVTSATLIDPPSLNACPPSPTSARAARRPTTGR